MNITRIASVPLITHDPFFSVWSGADHLYDADTVHWSGNRQQIRGHLTIDGKTCTFMGKSEFLPVIPQKSLKLSATSTTYTFENEEVELTVSFTSPLLPDHMLLVSRPCTYVDFSIHKKQAKEVSLHLEVSADLVRRTKDQVIGFAAQKANRFTGKNFSYVSMGRTNQQPLNHSVDQATIDWGYVYLASESQDARIDFDPAN